MRRFLITLIVSIVPATTFAADYTIDNDHSSVEFKIRHLAIANVNGAFGKFEGTISYDPKNIAASKTTEKISAESISTENAKRDDHLKNADFFNVTKFPELQFVSTETTGTPEAFKVMGDLTMHGITKPVVLDVTYNGSAKDPYGNDRVGFSATTSLNRKDFGLTWSKLTEAGAIVVGDEVKITLEIAGVKKAA
jgi:polyisoprenoid-binding protein YceI